MTTNILAPRDHNQPPDDDPLRERLDETHADLVHRKGELLSAEQRMPLVIDGDTLGRVSDFARQIKGCIKATEQAHEKEKAPFLQAGRTVDGWRNEIKVPLLELCARVERRITAYLAAKEAEERRKRIEEARVLEAEAKRLREAGDASAKDARAEARDLREDAKHATPADLVRTHTGMGGVTTLKTAVAFEVKNKEAAIVELWPYFDDDSIAKAVRAYIRAGQEELRAQVEAKKQPLPGVRLFIDRVASIR